MIRYRDVELAILLLILLVGMAAILIVIQQNTIQAFKKQAIEQECAKYNEVDGEFEWLRKDR